MHPVLTRKDFMGEFEMARSTAGARAPRTVLRPGHDNATDVWPVKKGSPLPLLHLTGIPTDASGP